MKLTDVKRTKADKTEDKERYEEPFGGDDYPHGLTINLDNATIEKLGLGDFDADESVRLHAEGFVSNDSTTKRKGKTDRSMTIQITKLALAQTETDDDKAAAMYEEG